MVGDMSGQGACVAEEGHAWQRGGHGRGGHVWLGKGGVGGEAATAADGTHHTGMHSCFF